MKVTVIGCGRWGSCITWYLDHIGQEVSLYGRAESPRMQRFLRERKNDLLELPDSVRLCTTLACAEEAEVIVISINSQGLRRLMAELSETVDLSKKIIVLCMKGIEIETGKRLTEVVMETDCPPAGVAVWLGPGHVQEFYAGNPNCMVIDSADNALTHRLVDAFTSNLIRFYYGTDLIGSEIGGAAKNVIGIAAGMLDGLHLSTLKGALMSRGTSEVARLIGALGGKPQSAYGLCHLGDYEATVFSEHSQNRRFGECLVQGKPYDKLAEGYYTVDAMVRIGKKVGVELPICEAVYSVLYEGATVEDCIQKLFSRSVRNEF
ncbi:MAG: NAD(P)H-dependent glycerol-3-phosphate dehydrogenase [Oscillospiraceae bacterium]|jgi:glycerol-3-phosphate dehydrogenase (NAD(P)+)